MNSALYFYRARTYDPKVGRFLQQDPLAPAPEEMNTYVYVRDNPLNFTDPSGMTSCLDPALDDLGKGLK